MERLTKRIFVPKEERELVVFTQGKYIDTIPAEMTHEDIRKVLRKLAEYEDLDEQGLLLRLPCGIGADVYFIPNETNYKLNILEGYPESNRVYHQTVERITFTPNGWYLECDKDLEYATDHILVDKLYKDTWFLSKAEAEQKLKEMENK